MGEMCRRSRARHFVKNDSITCNYYDTKTVMPDGWVGGGGGVRLFYGQSDANSYHNPCYNRHYYLASIILT